MPSAGRGDTQHRPRYVATVDRGNEQFTPKYRRRNIVLLTLRLHGLLVATATLFAAATLLVAAVAQSAETAPKPNVLFLLADDLGWGDVGFHQSEIQTPHIDRLAAAGARLEQFYVQSLCSPTRAALMTGRYPIRYGLQVGVVRPWAQYGLPLEECTLPQALRGAGYETAICGKWHLGHFQAAYLPTRRGFDHQYGLYNGMMDYFTHDRDGGLDWHRDDKPLVEEGYSTFLIAAEAVRIIQQHDAAKPLFLYVPFNAVHSPHQVPPQYAEPYAQLKDPRRTYCGMVAALDEAIGTVLAALEQKGLRRNTLIVFSSDNGGPNPGKVTSNGDLRAGKGTLYEGGVRVAASATWDGHIPAGSVVQAPLHMVDWYPTLLKLAGVSSQQKLPLDGKDAWPAIAGGKSSPHEEILLNSTPTAGAIRVGDWKLVINGDREHAAMDGAAQEDGGKKTKVDGKKAKAGEVVELFNIVQDPNEKQNLAGQQSAKLAELRARLETLAKQAAPPKTTAPAPGYKPPKVWGDLD
jgi:arylsulfatase A-like enzyme